MKMPPEIRCCSELVNLEQLLMYEYHGLQIPQQREAGQCFTEAARLLECDKELAAHLGLIWPRVEDSFYGSAALRARTAKLAAGGISVAESEVEAACEIATEAVEALRALRHRLHQDIRS